jgi:hypothetical protein
MGKDDFRKILIGAALAAAGAVLTYAELQVFPMLKENAGVWAPLLVSVQSTLLNAARKWLASQSSQGGSIDGEVKP